MKPATALKKYLLFCEAENLSESVIKDKKRHLEPFCLCQKKHIEKITYNDIIIYLNSLNYSEIKNCKIKIDIRAFFKFLFSHGYCSLNYELIKFKSAHCAIGNALTEEEFNLMDNKCHELLKGYHLHRKYVRWHALHHILWETGLRAIEMTRMDKWDNETKEFSVITAKTGRLRVGYFNFDLKPYLKYYKPKQYLFGISKRSLQNMVQVLSSVLNRRITAHSYRRGYITRLINNGANITDVACLAGHIKIESTYGYWRASHLKDVYNTHIQTPKTFEMTSNIGIRTKYRIKLQITKNK